MKKRCLPITAFLSSIFLLSTFCQAQNPVNLPSVLPPSPNAAELGRYGDIPLNYSTGALNLSIPIYEYQTKNINVPISISYTSNGFQVNKLASRVGFDWALNAGGVISCTVHGESDVGYLGLTPTRLAAPDFNVKNQALLNYLNAVSGAGFDSEPDIFSFNFQGYNGQFIIGNDGKPLLLSHGSFDIKYESTSAESKFTIRTPDGVKYFFGGLNATELSKSMPGQNCGAQGHDDLMPNAWYLTRIEHPDGDFVSFLYESKFNQYFAGIRQTLTRAIGQTSLQKCDEGGTLPQSCPVIADETCTTEIYSEVVRLKEITSSSAGKIEFNYVARTDINSGDDGLVSSIVFFGLNDERMFKTGFIYTDGNNRPFLSQLLQYGKTDNTPKSHQFFYNKLNELPGRLSFSQDHFGYYNGKENFYLVPLPQYVSQRTLFNNKGGNREPDWNFASKGLLNKIVYPTAGKTEIEYEGNDINITEEIHAEPAPLTITAIGTDQSFNADELVTTTSSDFLISEMQFTELSLSYTNVNGVNDQDHHIRMEAVLLNKTTGLPIVEELLQPYESLQIPVTLQAGVTYSLQISVLGYAGYQGKATMQYFVGTAQTVTHNKQMCGVRVAKIKSYSENSATPSIKRFRYGFIDDMTKSSGVQISPNPIYISTQRSGFSCHPMGWTVPFLVNCDYSVLHSNSLTFSFSRAANNIFYKSVLVSEGENFENGGTEYTFKVTSDAGAFPLIGVDVADTPFSNSGFDCGSPLLENQFKSVNSQIIYVRKLQNFYKVDSRVQQLTKGVYVRKNFDMPVNYSPPRLDYDFVPFDAAMYYLNTRWHYIEKTEVTDFDINGNVLVSNTINHFYDNPIHALKTRTVKSDSRGNDITEETKYPQDITSSGNEEIARAELINSYQTGKPIEMITSINGTIQKSHLIYTKRSDNKCLLEKVETNTGVNNTMEERLLYSRYDAKGNILEVSKKDDYRTVYVWGYNFTYPLAEIKNASYQDVIDVLGQSVLDELNANPGSDDLVRTKLQPLLNHSRFSNAEITIRTYNPPIGLTSVTDNNNNTTKYEYDDFGRLKQVLDSQGNIVRAYQYNYKKQVNE